MSQGFTKGIAISTDGTLSENSDLIVSSQKAIKTYVASGLATKQDLLGYTAENTANKTDVMSGNTTSSTKYLSAKGVYDWVISLGYITISSLSGYATQAWVAAQGYVTNVITSLGYTPENVANKSDSYTVSSSTTYASTKALVDGLATKQATLTKIGRAHV